MQLLNHKGNLITDEKITAKEFNHYFCEIGRKLAAQIKTNIDYKVYMTDTNPNSMFLQPVEEYKIAKIISTLRTKKSVADIDIPIKLLKRCTNDIKTPLCYKCHFLRRAYFPKY